MGTRRRPPAVRPPAYASASAPRVRSLQKALRLGWSAILDALLICCRPAQPLPLQLPHAVCSGLRSGALVLRPVLLCDPPDGRSALSLPLPSRTAAPPCRSRLAANTPGADQRPAPILCRSAYPGTRAPAPSARLLVSRSASGACFALLCAVIKRAHADSLQRARRPPASALRPALRSAQVSDAPLKLRALRGLAAPCAPSLRQSPWSNGGSIFHRFFLALPLVSCAVAWWGSTETPFQSRVKTSGRAALDRPSAPVQTSKQGGCRPRPAGILPPLLILFWWCCVCSVWLLLALVRSLIMIGLPPIWTGCCLAVCLPWRSSAAAAPPALMLWPCAMRMSVGLHCASSRRSGGCMVLPLARSAMRLWLRMAMPWLHIGTAAPLALHPWCAVLLRMVCAWFCAASEPFTYKETATSGVDSTDAR